MPDFAALEQKYGLPPGLLAAQQQVESSGNSSAVSPAGARGPAQLMPATAKALGVTNPHDPMQAAEAQARLWRENLNATGGDLDAAAMRYHGGTDPKNWGPLTKAYPAKIVAALQAGAQSRDPFEAALSGGQAKANDPFEAALKGDTSAANGVPGPSGKQAPDDASPAAGNAGGRDGQGAVPALDVRPSPRALPGDNGSLQEGTGEGRLQAFGRGLSDTAVGFGRGINDIANTVEVGGARALDAFGVTDNLADAARKDANASDEWFKSHMFHPEGWAQFGGRLAGGVAGFEGSGLGNTKLLKITEETGKLAKALKYAGQGAAMGTMASGGDNIIHAAAIGAALGPVGGAIGEKVIAPAIGKAGEVYTRLGGPDVARMLREYAGKSEASTIPDGIPDMPKINDPAAPFGRWGNGAPKTADDVALEANGLTGEVTDDRPAFDPKKAGAAIEADVARRGIRSVVDLPADASSAASDAVARGVPEDQAYREAAIRYVGAEPTIATSTRSRAEWRAEREGAKLDTPEGHALANRIADNNEALHNAAIKTVDEFGGMPTNGEATQGAAEALAKASDAEKAKVSRAYANARAQDGDQRVTLTEVNNLLKSRAYSAPATAEETTLANGLRKQIAAMAKENKGKFSPEEIEELNQYVNRAYNPLGGGANHMVTELRGALNVAFDGFENAGPAFKAARRAHKAWAEQYDDPEGIAGLIKRDAKGNFVNSDAWRKLEGGALNGTSDRAFTQIVKQLQKVGATDALNKLKAEIVQRAYEQATRTAANETGRAVFSGAQWNATLDKIGMKKLQALFSPEELAHLSTIGRAARYLNESIPGAENTSGTASALANALAKRGEKLTTSPLANAAETGAHFVAGHVLPGAGNVGVKVTADALKGRAAANTEAENAKALAEALKRNLDPNYAREAANDDAEAAAALARKKALGRAVGARSGTAGAAAQQKENN